MAYSYRRSGVWILILVVDGMRRDEAFCVVFGAVVWSFLCVAF